MPSSGVSQSAPQRRDEEGDCRRDRSQDADERGYGKTYPQSEQHMIRMTSDNFELTRNTEFAVEHWKVGHHRS